MNEWTVDEFLHELDGDGLIITDEDLLIETLSRMGIALFDFIETKKPSEIKGETQ